MLRYVLQLLPYSDRIQEIHIKVIHIMIEALEAAVAKNNADR